MHRPGVDLTLVVVEGEGRATIGEKEHPLTPGVVAFVPSGEPRGILKKSRLVILHIVTPPPTEADHAEVQAGLKTGKWR